MLPTMPGFVPAAPHGGVYVALQDPKARCLPFPSGTGHPSRSHQLLYAQMGAYHETRADRRVSIWSIPTRASTHRPTAAAVPHPFRNAGQVLT